MDGVYLVSSSQSYALCYIDVRGGKAWRYSYNLLKWSTYPIALSLSTWEVPAFTITPLTNLMVRVYTLK